MNDKSKLKFLLSLKNSATYSFFPINGIDSSKKEFIYLINDYIEINRLFT